MTSRPLPAAATPDVPERLKRAVVEHYERQLHRFGPTARGMDWKDEASQRLRFEVLTGVADLAGRTVLEIGAGAGHLRDFLRERGVAAAYAGIDLSAEMVAAARRRHPDVPFEQRDILADPPPPADVVLCSGLFHVKLDHGEGEWRAFVEAMLRRMFETCRVALAFNLMSDQVDFRSPSLFYANPGEILDFCRRELGRFVALRHDYPLHEFTVYVYRDRPAPAGTAPCLSVVMPGLNEEENVERAVGRTVRALEQLGTEFEVLVIDDGSTDRTGEIAERLAAEDRRVRVLRNERNLNYGVSLARGLAAARGDWVLHDGMDLPLAPEDIARIVPHLVDADIVVVRRTDRAAHSAWRKLTSWTNGLLLRTLFRPRASDLNFVQFYRRAAVVALPLRSTSPAFVTPELIIRAERAGLRVREVEAEFRRREAGRAHFGKPRDIWWTLRDMLRLRLRTWLRGWEA